MIEYLDVNGFRLHETDTRALSAVSGLTGIPGARTDSVDRPGADGGVEPTNAFMPARTITLEGELWGETVPEAWSEWDALAPVLEAALRRDATLTWRKVGSSVDLQTTVRLISDVSPKFSGDEYGPRIVYQAQLRAADPRHYSILERDVEVQAPGNVGGFALPLVFPLDFTAAAGSGGGELVVTNGGNTRTWPLVTIFGPINGPVIRNETKNARLAFPTLELADGEALAIDMNPKTRSALVAGVNALGSLDWSDARFFAIAAGASETLSFSGLAEGYGSNTRMTVSLRDAFIS